MRRVLFLWLTGSALGGALVALPDRGERVFSLSRTHGPAPVDLLGIVVLLLASLPVLLALRRNRHLVGRPVWALSGGLAVVAGVALAVTVVRDLGWWWLPSALLLALAQVLPAVVAAHGEQTARADRSGRARQPGPRAGEEVAGA